MNIEVLIADDHQVVLDGLSSLIKGIKGFQVIGTAKDGWEVIDYIEKNGLPDLLLMDITMPRKDGIETMEYLKEKDNIPPTIMLSMHLSKAYVKRLLDLGVKGYLQKDCDKKELVQALKDVSEGGTYLSKNVTELLVEQNSVDENTTSKKAPKISKRESQILHLLLEEYSTRKIAEELGISFNTVETHRKHLLNKFGVRSTVGLIREAMRMGTIK